MVKLWSHAAQGAHNGDGAIGSNDHRARAWQALALAAVLFATAGGPCPTTNEPCVDGVGGDRANDETAIAIKLINDSSGFVHLIGSRETNDPCNRVIDGGSRFIFVPGDRIAYSVRAISNGVLLDEITCTLPEEQTVRYLSDGTLICVNTGG